MRTLPNCRADYFPVLHLRYLSEMRTLSVKPKNRPIKVAPCSNRREPTQPEPDLSTDAAKGSKISFYL